VLRAELEGIICSGARRGAQFTYALLESRAASATSRTRDESLVELATRYFATRSPATVQDFAWWSGLTMSDARRAVQLADSTLVTEDIGGREYWSNPSARADAIDGPIVHLLPNYDEYFIGFKDRSAIAERVKSRDLSKGPSGLVAHIVTVDGQLAGGWRRVVRKGTTFVRVNLLTRLRGAERRALEDAVESLGVFLGTPVTLENAATSPSRTSRRTAQPPSPTRR
jgi:hypothetical protein